MKNYNLSDNINRSNILTEESNHLSKNIDTVSTSKLVDIFVEEDKKPQQAISQAKHQITKSIDLIYQRLIDNGRLFYIGAGTSGRIAVLDAVECPPTFCTSPELVQAVIAGGSSSLINSSEEKEDSNSLSIKDLKERNFSSKDCLIGITAGGTTPYVLSGLNYARNIGALNIAITSVPEQQASFGSNITIRLITGPEIIAGSTRLKAGTATKMALNIISSGVMIKLGKVFDNKMIDVSISNKKLFDRALRITSSLLNIEMKEAQLLLDQAKGSIKVACIIKSSGMDQKSAFALLERNNHNLRKALKDINIEF
ncbi:MULTISPECIES: N-acetylmuramic acid 6-phosphate etherase [Prochlorococcus]|uniref:N-acetylmuramic acid 6-phosphate etherase n=1 Tax=Prochlorococcus marinus (strain SARG / CCMP1375 / SS120) TaxID=167539 RepID=MURQ_PROMA|nr:MULTISPECIES: N-acetylmuramic acid 6-phosphate etherase [Prochlorococcus]Q7VC01.1 RecName: Full=N-acetylmuramic acid 6-phosphate etherase; Short=MurNAc-6-P etherase; AltName: Full=N-acetylmuramic acid 6-phosphate hydrolase; AltName: Full=N-acetylmuramic acid 6-phosphate lyase [Prochlorococcus marinus subsp. marinus str. CCMP1375]AAP99985.1 Sugar phosphate isomerase [Prochlorococcus marinus subsp. marinus str. CCMP1375]KGG13783.1 N-acetylmuramic acid 6-phosphate etherase [Prochlorococcus marin